MTFYTPAAGDADQYNELGEPSGDAGPGAAPSMATSTLRWCSWTAQPAVAPDGYCEFCGCNSHVLIPSAADLARWNSQ